MSNEQIGVDFNLLGEQIEKLWIGSAGQRNGDGSISALSGKEGHIFYGPYLALPPGPYSVRMIFSAELLPEQESDGPGVEFEVTWENKIIASFPLDEASLEAGVVALPFNVPEEGGTESARLEIRVLSRGLSGLSVASVDLRRMQATFRRLAESAAPRFRP